jgi:hypothetical protein
MALPLLAAMQRRRGIGYPCARRIRANVQDRGSLCPARTRQALTDEVVLTKKLLKKSKRVQDDKNYIEVMGKIFAVLEYFVEHSNKRKSLMFSEIAASLPFARTTVHRILYSLDRLGYIEKMISSRVTGWRESFLIWRAAPCIFGGYWLSRAAKCRRCCCVSVKP